MAEAGSDWTEGEVDLIVADYFDMLAMELRGAPFVKARRNAALQELTGAWVHATSGQSSTVQAQIPNSSHQQVLHPSE